MDFAIIRISQPSFENGRLALKEDTQVNVSRMGNDAETLDGFAVGTNMSRVQTARDKIIGLDDINGSESEDRESSLPTF